MTQTQRHEALVQFIPLFDSISNGSVYVIPKLAVDLDTDDGQKTFIEFNRDTVDAGYEGIMVKDPLAPYQTKRTFAWLKIKPFISVDLEVVGFEPGKPEGKFANTLGGILFKGVDQGKLIKVTVGGGYSEDLRDKIWNNQADYLGLIGEVRGDMLTQNRDDENSWSVRFPEFERFRGWLPGQKI